MDAASLADRDVFEFLEDDEFDYPYRLCRVPAACFTAVANADPRDFMDGMLPPRESVDYPEEIARFTDLRAWFDTEGIETALAHRPVIALLHNDRLKVLDGFHRLYLLIHEYGIGEITTAVGLGPPMEA
ncbi:hypothetical protein CKO28_00390 [Rhodovibrio sodomensis]|uniref:ParB/Sulfiredoxin domain-containing protein n=1 Tax=Rhodovibrio sodomensis TaxID=1088 RepID=A0ABS1DA70_9PROT|nr:hypothetical protein [Rhodovibrio sodomensis]